MKKRKNVFTQVEADAQRLISDPAAKGIAQNILDYIKRHRDDQ